MLIEGLTTLLAFLVFVAPGALWSWLAERRQDTPERGDVLTVALITLSSVVFSLPASVVPMLIAFNTHLGQPRLIDEFFTKGIGTPGEAARLAILLTLQLAIAAGLVWLVYRLFAAKIFGTLQVVRKNHWMYELEKFKQAGIASILAEVRLDDGVMIRGLIELSSEQSAQDERELTLRDPIRVDDEDGTDLLDGRTPSKLTIAGGAIKFVALYPVAPPPPAPAAAPAKKATKKTAKPAKSAG